MTTINTPLFPAIEPYNSGFLPVDDTHTLYYEESGNPEGKPVVFLHGGPGGGTTAINRCFWDPQAYRIILFDQRGCGKSTPHACLDNNTTWHLVSDIELLREFLGIERWQVFGGSWGSTLSLAYGIKHPERVTELVLRGIFMLRKKELQWFYQEGASNLFPDAWDAYEQAIPEDERGDFIKAYYQRLTGEDEAVKLASAQAWSVWEGSTSRLYPDPAMIDNNGSAQFALSFARIECHYFINKGFFDTDEWLLENVDKIAHIPTVIAQGRYDVVCPMRSAWDLSKALPKARLDIIPDAGHASIETGIAAALVAATEQFKND